MAERFWPGENPLDRQVRVTAGDEASGWLRIVGVVDDVRHSSLAREPVPEMYRPIAQMPMPDFSVAIRTVGDPTALAAAARGVVQSLDRNLPIYDVRTMEARIASSVAQTRATASLLLATALLAAAARRRSRSTGRSGTPSRSGSGNRRAARAWRDAAVGLPTGHRPRCCWRRSARRSAPRWRWRSRRCSERCCSKRARPIPRHTLACRRPARAGDGGEPRAGAPRDAGRAAGGISKLSR